MFGWRQVGATRTDRSRFGLYLETFSTGLWLNVYWGRRSWAFTRYSKNRHTGPSENHGVLAHFFGGPDRRARGSVFTLAHKEAATKPIPSAFHNDHGECHCRMCLASPAARALLSERAKRYAER